MSHISTAGHSSQSPRPNLGHAFAIEVQDRSAGIAVAERSGYTFYVADQTFRDLDRRTFRNIAQLERAARLLLHPHSASRHAPGRKVA